MYVLLSLLILISSTTACLPGLGGSSSGCGNSCAPPPPPPVGCGAAPACGGFAPPSGGPVGGAYQVAPHQVPHTVHGGHAAYAVPGK